MRISVKSVSTIDGGNLYDCRPISPSLQAREQLFCSVIRDRLYKKDPNCLLRVYQFNKNTAYHLLIERSNKTPVFVPLPSDWYESIPATIVYVVNRLFAHRLRTPKDKDA